MAHRSVLTVALVIAFSAAAASTQAFAEVDGPMADIAPCALVQAVAGLNVLPAP